jgi:arsenite-transporting ATPase
VKRSGEHAAAPGFHFFAGKGGVGKTTCAAATALDRAERGARVLLVSTDPAHSLADALDQRLTAVPRRVPTRRGALLAVELDADAALTRWLRTRARPLRTIAERGTYLDEDDIERLLRLSFPGVDELMGLVELSRLADGRTHDEVVVDTAPTGHTLRLLAMPEALGRVATVLDHMHAKHRFLAESLGGGYRPDAADGLIAEVDAHSRGLAALLRDPRRCRFSWLLVPEPLALEEARDGIRALDAAGIAVSEVLVNRASAGGRSRCRTCAARAAAEQRVIAAAQAAFAGRRVRCVPAVSREPRGLAALRPIGRALRAPERGPRGRAARVTSTAPGACPARLGPAKPGGARATPPRTVSARPLAWPVRLAPPGVRLLAFAGKGGVGKTTTAAAAALTLAAERPDARVLLLSTDPAHSLADVLEAPVGDLETAIPGAPAGLRVRELDAAAALAERRDRYRTAVDQLFDSILRRSRLDVAYDREVVQELMELAPPGLDELFGVLSVLEALFPGHEVPYDLVVVDTAPTGHALRLFALPASALEWVHALLAILLKYRQVIGLGQLAADLVATAQALRRLTGLLGHPGQARVVAVTRAAALPRLETERLMASLARLGVACTAVLVNAMTIGTCEACRSTRRREDRVAEGFEAPDVVLAPALAPPPRGVAGLAAWARDWEIRT